MLFNTVLGHDTFYHDAKLIIKIKIRKHLSIKLFKKKENVDLFCLFYVFMRKIKKSWYVKDSSNCLVIQKNTATFADITFFLGYKYNKV